MRVNRTQCWFLPVDPTWWGVHLKCRIICWSFVETFCDVLFNFQYFMDFCDVLHIVFSEWLVWWWFLTQLWISSQRRFSVPLSGPKRTAFWGNKSASRYWLGAGRPQRAREMAINHHTESYPINPPMLMAGLLIPIKCSLNGLKPYSIICLIWEMGYAAIYGLWLGQYIISCHIISYMYNIHISTG
jgi:hypothetical protein